MEAKAAKKKVEEDDKKAKAADKKAKAAEKKAKAAEKKEADRITPAQGVPAPTITENLEGDYPQYTFTFKDGTEYKGIKKDGEILIDDVPQEEFKAFSPAEAARKLQARQAKTSQQAQAAKAMVTGEPLKDKDTDTDTTPSKSMDEIVDGVNLARESELAKNAKSCLLYTSPSPRD